MWRQRTGLWSYYMHDYSDDSSDPSSTWIPPPERAVMSPACPQLLTRTPCSVIHGTRRRQARSPGMSFTPCDIATDRLTGQLCPPPRVYETSHLPSATVSVPALVPAAVPAAVPTRSLPFITLANSFRWQWSEQRTKRTVVGYNRQQSPPASPLERVSSRVPLVPHGVVDHPEAGFQLARLPTRTNMFTSPSAPSPFSLQISYPAFLHMSTHLYKCRRFLSDEPICPHERLNWYMI